MENISSSLFQATNPKASSLDLLSKYESIIALITQKISEIFRNIKKNGQDSLFISYTYKKNFKLTALFRPLFKPQKQIKCEQCETVKMLVSISVLNITNSESLSFTSLELHNLRKHKESVMFNEPDLIKACKVLNLTFKI